MRMAVKTSQKRKLVIGLGLGARIQEPGARIWKAEFSSQ